MDDSKISAKILLARARRLYDDPTLPFAQSASQDAWKSGFASGADWMRLVIGHLRNGDSPSGHAAFQQLGFVKYGLASLGAMLYAVGVLVANAWILLPGSVLVFYAIEAQMVFLFPLALDGSPKPYQDSLLWTRKAGGTLFVAWNVMQLAVVMIFGGFLGKGFVRSWCLGCLSVLLWYEQLRTAQ